MIKYMRKCFLVGCLILMVFSVKAQQQGLSAYRKVLTERAGKIVATLGITDSAQFFRVSEVLVNQYEALGKIHDYADSITKVLQATKPSNESIVGQIKQEENIRDAKLYQQHCSFIAQLQGELNADQVEAVKNGMTYNVLNVTYKAQLEMIPTLKDNEKRQIRTWLLEAREHAMDAASSDKKHAWFGKYKGRINNYLSARGYDLTKERADWTERLKQKTQK